MLLLVSSNDCWQLVNITKKLLESYLVTYNLSNILKSILLSSIFLKVSATSRISQNIITRFPDWKVLRVHHGNLANRGFPKFFDSIKLIELIWKIMIGSLELIFLLPILHLIYIVLLIPVTAKKFFLKKLHILNILYWCLFTMYSKHLSATK